MNFEIRPNYLHRENIEDVYPMSDIQLGIFYHSVKAPDSGVYHVQQVTIFKDANFDPEILTKTVTLLVEKHPMLRTCFIMSDFKEPVQIVLKRITPDIEHVDISHMSKSKQQQFLKSFLAKDIKISFDLQNPVILWRIRTFSLDDETICFIWICHHAIGDGWSSASLMTELNNTYITLKSNPNFVPKKLKNTYKQFVLEQRLEKKNKKNINYWQNELAGYKRLTFPGHFTGENKYTEKKSFVRVLGNKLKEQLKQTARNYNTSLKNLCFAAYICMLNMVSYDGDIVTGLVTSSRPVCEDGDKILGCFLNTIPVRIKIPAHPRWVDYIRLVESKLLELASFDKLSLMEIVKIIGEKTGKQNPIFDVAFNFVEFHIYQQLSHQPIPGKLQDKDEHHIPVAGMATSNVLFGFIVDNTLGTLSVSIFYSPSIVAGQEEWVANLYGYFKYVLHRMAHYPEETAAKASILPEQEREKLLYGFNRTHTIDLPDKLIHRLIEEQAEHTPKRPAVKYLDKELTYTELNEKANQLARLLKRCGVGKDQMVGILLNRSPQMMESIIAAWKAGGAYIPLDTQYPAQRINEILKDSGTRVLITQSVHARTGKEKEYSARIIELDLEAKKIASQDTGNPNLEVSINDLAYVIYTSGSTGKPKGVMVEHIGMINHIGAKIEELQVTGNSVVAQNASHTFDISVWQFFAALVLGGKAVIYPDLLVLDPEQFITNAARDKITILELVPSYLSILLDTCDAAPGKLDSLTTLVVTGETLKPNLVKRWFVKYPDVKLVNAYGPTEASDDITHYMIDKPLAMDRVPIGHPLCNFNIYIVDKNMELCPIGVKGEICVSGIGVGRGYLNNPELTSEKFIDKALSSLLLALRKTERAKKELRVRNQPRAFQEIPGARSQELRPNPPTLRTKSQEPRAKLYKTGDIGRWLPHGNIEFLGRKDHQVKIRGYRIELGEIESQLVEHPEVREAVVTHRVDNQGDGYLNAYLVMVNRGGLKVSQIREYLLERLPDYMVPANFLELDEMPLTPTGKIDRQALPESVLNPSTSMIYISEKMLAELKAANEKANPGISTDQLHEFFSKNVELEKKETLAMQAYSAQTGRDCYPLTHSQKMIYFSEKRYMGTSCENINNMVSYPQILDRERLEQAINMVLLKNEALRLRVIEIEYESAIVPGQYVEAHHHYHPGYLDFSADNSKKALEEWINTNNKTPFQFLDSDLYYFAYIKFNDRESGYYMKCHHIVSDHWTIILMFSEIDKIYKALTCGETIADTRNPSYLDYIPAEHDYFNSQQVKDDIKFWHDYLLPLPEAVSLSWKKAEPGSIEGDVTVRTFPGALRNRIHEYCRANKTSIFKLLLSVLSIYVSQVTGVDDFVIGTLNHNRAVEKYQKTFGTFIRFIPLRIKVDHSKSFNAFVKETGENVNQVLKNHSQYPFDFLINELREKTGIDPGYLYNINLLGHPDTGKEDFTFKRYFPAYETTPLSLHINLNNKDIEGILELEWNYQVEQYSASDIEAIHRGLIDTLTETLDTPGKKISRFQQLPGNETLQSEIVPARGVKVEIERRLLKHEHINEAVVLIKSLGRTTMRDNTGNNLYAYVVAGKSVTAAGVREYLGKELPHEMIPQHFVQLEKMPLTREGKVDTKVLPVPDFKAKKDYTPPGSEIEKKLVEIWAEILEIDKETIGVTDNFFELGGHSLKASILVLKIHKEINVKLSLAKIFKNPSIRGLAGFIKGARQERYASIEPIEKKDYYTLSSAQKRLYILQHMETDNISYNMPQIIPLAKDIDQNNLQMAFKKLISRHESLRTSFEMMAQEPVQKVHDQVDFTIRCDEIREEDWEDMINNFTRPFDLSQPPLLRVKLVSLSSPAPLLVLDMHHIISDGTTHMILTGDFMSLYNGDGEKLEPLRIQYKDFSQWQNHLFAVGEIETQEKYWLELFADAAAVPRLDLPADFKRPEVFTFKGDRYNFILEREEAAKFKALGAKNNGTLYMNILTALNTLFYKYTGQTDIIIGCGTAGRPHKDLQQIVGMFVNTLAMRNCPEGEKTYESFLQEVIARSVKAFENQDVQFEELVDRLEVERDPSRNPLFDIDMVVQNFREAKPGDAASGRINPQQVRQGDSIDIAEQLPLPDKKLPKIKYDFLTAKFDMTFFVFEKGGRIHFCIEYYTGIFKLETIMRLVSHFKNVVNAVVREPSIKLKDINILSGAEKETLLYTFNDTTCNYPGNKTIPRLFAEQVIRGPHCIALVHEDKTLTYNELDIRARQLARYLGDKKGIHPGNDHRVGIILSPGVNLLISILGILKSGAAYVPLDPRLPRERIKFVIDDAGIRTVISGKKYIKTLDQLQWECDNKYFRDYLCIDSYDVHGEEEASNVSMNEKFLLYVGETATDDITGGGWLSSYTGETLSREEMDQYGNNILEKLRPFLHKQTRVLEIGCASGISMYRIAPLVGLYYGTDLSGIIIEKNKERIKQEGHTNITLTCTAAHNIDQIDEKNFDIIIFNSVIQFFPGHNYLRNVIHKCIDLMATRGYLFIGDVQDHELKQSLIRDLKKFKRHNPEAGRKTKTNWSMELFVHRGFFQDLVLEIPGIQAVEFSNKIHTIENELTKFRYDALFRIDKPAGLQIRKEQRPPGGRRKYQDDLTSLPSFEKKNIPEPGEKTVNPGDLAYVIYTSGTTGKPKGVLVEHRSVVNLISSRKRYFNLHESERVLQFSPPWFDASVEQIFLAFSSGAGLILVDKETLLDDHRFNSLLMKQCITHLNAVPSFLNQLGLHANNQLQRILSGGEVCPVSLARKLKRCCDFYNLYGPTETTVTSMVMRVEENIETMHHLPIGKPIDNTSVYIMDNWMKLVPIGAAGELYIGGAGVARGYLNRPELTFERFIKNNRSSRSYKSYIYKTGDLARWLPDGNIEFLGRIDQQVKIRGFRIELPEIRNRLLEHDEIKEAVVIDQEEEDSDKYLCAYLVAKRTAQNAERIGESLDTKDLRDYMSEMLPEYMIPSYFIFLDKIPLSPNGKIDRKKLPAPSVNIGTGEGYIAPGDEIEKQLVEIWSEMLEIESGKLSIDANFFHLGGHSLKATILVSKIHKKMDVKLPLAEVFKTPTIRGLAWCIKKAAKDKYTSLQAIEKKNYHALSSAQKRLYFLQQLDLQSTSYNMPFVLSLGKGISKDKPESTLKQLIARHESLRTSFITVNEIPMQRIHDYVDFEIEYYDMKEVEVKEGTGGLAPLPIKNFIRPFDLSRVSLLRSRLIKLPDGNYTWMVDMHHIISDGTSHTILTQDFFSLYNGEELEPLRIQYKDFSHWQNRLLAIGEIETREKYWLELFADAAAVPRLELPADFKRPEVFTFAGDRYNFKLEREDAVKFKALGSQNNGTLYMNILASLNTLFYKYTGQTDIIMGSGIAGRPHADLQHIVGMFINTLAMRNYPEGEKTYESFLQEVIARSVKAFENQDVQFEDLVDKLQVERDASRNPLFDITMVVQNFQTPGQHRGQQGAKRDDFNPVQYRLRSDENLTSNNPTAKFDMTFFVSEKEDNIFIQIEYYTAIFREETITRLVRHFKQVIKQVVSHPLKKLADIDIVPEQERQQLLIQLNNTAAPYPTNKTISRLFAEQVNQTPDVAAVVFKDSILTYKNLDERSHQLANYLIASQDIKPGVPVGIMMEKFPEMIIAILGVIKAGGAYLPLDPGLPENRLKLMIDDSCLGTVISQKKLIKILNRLQWECKSFRTFLCTDSTDIYGEEEDEPGLMDQKLWDYVAESAVDEITWGGWLSSYTGEPFSKEEMDEYGDNALKKLTPLLHRQMRVLEIGCSSGITMYRLASKVGYYLGTDLSPITIEKNKKRVKEEGHENIELACLAAHEIDKIEKRNFDLIIINSVIQAFPGHNYLRKVITKTMGLLRDQGYLFIGDIMDQDLKKEMIRYMMEFKRANRGKNYKTKTDWSEELFISRSFFEDLIFEIPGILDIEFSHKIYTIKNELTLFRYDALLRVNKSFCRGVQGGGKHKYQEDALVLRTFPVSPPGLVVPPGQAAYVIYTSGSTGKPKGVMVEHGNIVRLVKGFEPVKWPAGSRLLLTGAFAFDISTFEIWAPLLNGAALVLADKTVILNSEELEKTIKELKITHLHLIPQLFNQLAAEQPGIFAVLRYFLVGGDRVRPGWVNEIRQMYPHLNILHMYGPTENTVFSTFFPVDRVYEGPLPIGRPTPNSTVYILDKHGHLQPIGAVGELYVGGDGVARGYLNNPELTNSKFQIPNYKQIPNPKLQITNKETPINKKLLRGIMRKAQSAGRKANNTIGAVRTAPCAMRLPPGRRRQKIYQTGDLVRWTGDLQLEFLGRVDRQVKVRGFRIETAEIENQLLEHSDIKETLVTAGIDESEDQSLCAYVVPTGGDNSEIDFSDLRLHLSRKLPAYMIPAHFVNLEKIPLTLNGKIDMKALPDPQVKPGEDYTAPATPIEETLVGLWSDLLGIEKRLISTTANFFELGGHSLKATVFAARAHKALDIKIPIAEIFKTPFIRELAQYIQNSRKDPCVSIEPVEKREYYALSSAQKRIYLRYQLDKQSLGYHINSAVVFEGNPETGKLENTFKKLIKRHESFRTSFHMLEDEEVQRVHDQVVFKVIQPAVAKYPEDHVIKDMINNFIRPFDLSKAPLLRAALIKETNTRYILVLDMHHIISDGVSMEILMGDFTAIFAGEELPGLRIQYKDYAKWQKNEYKVGTIKEQESFWLEIFKGEPPVLNLPLDYNRPPVQSFEGDRVSFEIKPGEMELLRELMIRENVTLYMVLLAVFNIFLAKISGQENIVVGTPTSGRRHADLEPITGMFVGTLALPNHPSGEKTFKDFLKEVKERTLQAFDHQDYPFEILVNKMGIKRDPSRHPLFETFFALQNESAPDIRMPRLKLKPYKGLKTKTTPFDLFLSAFEGQNRVFLNLEYCTKLFKAETIESFTRYFKQILASILENKHIKLGKIEISHRLLSSKSTRLKDDSGEFGF